MSFVWTDYFIVRPTAQLITMLKGMPKTTDSTTNLDDLLKPVIVEKLGAVTRTNNTDPETQALVVKLLWVSRFVKFQLHDLDETIQASFSSVEPVIDLFERYWQIEHIEQGYHVDILAEDIGPAELRTIAQTGISKVDEWLLGRADMIDHDKETWIDHVRCESP